MRTAIQLYTLRDLDRGVPGLLEDAAAAGLDGVEFAHRLPESDLDAVRAALDATGLGVAGAHVPMDAVEEDADLVARYRRVHCDTLVVPHLPASAFGSPDAVAATARRLDDAAARLDATLCYHNHDHEFEPVGGRPALEALAARTEHLRFEFDTGLAARAGVDPVDVMGRLERVHAVHLTDTAPADPDRPHVVPGRGVVDVDGCIDAARDAGVAWVVYEHGVADDQRAQLAHAGSLARRVAGAGG